MASYTTLDFIPDLTSNQIYTAGGLTFSPYLVTDPDIPWDTHAFVEGDALKIPPNPILKIDLVEGATYDLFSLSRGEPGSLRIFDESGNAISNNIESDDGDPFSLNNVSFFADITWEFRAPYTGTYYIQPSYNWSNVYGFYRFDIFGDTDTAVNFPGQSLVGGVGNDNIVGTNGQDTIIAMDGNDTVTGSVGADDLNGNRGGDRVVGGPGADTVRGGQDNDSIYGDDGNDPHVNGNLGDDLVFGGFGDDTLYGGQGADTLRGGHGDDFVSGDLGSGDILYGEAGADRFGLRGGSGSDWAADFRAADGDRIELATGAVYSASSYDNQVVIRLASGDDLGLAGVAAGSFQSNWIIFV